MASQHRASLSRRELLKTVGVGSLALAGFGRLGISRSFSGHNAALGGCMKARRSAIPIAIYSPLSDGLADRFDIDFQFDVVRFARVNAKRLREITTQEFPGGTSGMDRCVQIVRHRGRLEAPPRSAK